MKNQCSFCGHPPHDQTCPRTIRVTVDKKTATDVPCPCARRKEHP